MLLFLENVIFNEVLLVREIAALMGINFSDLRIFKIKNLSTLIAIQYDNLLM